METKLKLKLSTFALTDNAQEPGTPGKRNQVSPSRRFKRQHPTRVKEIAKRNFSSVSFASEAQKTQKFKVKTVKGKECPTRDQWFTKEYLGGEKTVGQMLNNFQPMPGDQTLEKFLYFYGAYAPKANIHKFMQYESLSQDKLT